MLFQNNPVEVSSLPQIDDISMESLSPSYLKVSYLGTTIFFMILLVVLIGIRFFAEFVIPFWCVFFRSTTVIPFNRIQHAEVKQGPIERRFNLQRLEVYSAGGEGSDLYIPGLLGNRADQLKDFIIKKVGRHEQ